jgi:single-strand DNA-binding protein
MGARKSATKEPRSAGGDEVDQVESLNQVRLQGRLSADPQLRELPSGDTMWHLRVVVERPAPAGQERPRQRVDSLECAVRTGRLKSQVGRWSAGDVVEVAGALRCRFFRVGGATASRVEVELTGGRIIRRARTG